MKMKITAKITKIFNDEKKLKAFANLIFDGSFVVKGVRVMSGDRGLFVAMPSERASDGQYYDTAYPCTTECESKIEGVVIMAYASKLAQNQAQDLAQEETLRQTEFDEEELEF